MVATFQMSRGMGCGGDLPRNVLPLEPCRPFYMRVRVEAASRHRFRAVSHRCGKPASSPGGEAQNNEWRFPKRRSFCHIRFSSYPTGQSKTPELGCLSPSGGSEAVAWPCQGGTSVTGRGTDQWMGAEGISQPPGQDWGCCAERKSACSERRGSEGRARL